MIAALALAVLAQAPNVDVGDDEPQSPANTTSIGLHAGVSAGMAVLDVTSAPMYGFISAPIGVALLSEGAMSIALVGLGWTTGLGPAHETMWMFDVFVMGGGGTFQPGVRRDILGTVGVGFGFRLLHSSGFTLGFKLPLMGAGIGAFISDVGTSIGHFFLLSLVSVPFVSIGWRF